MAPTFTFIPLTRERGCQRGMEWNIFSGFLLINLNGLTNFEMLNLCFRYFVFRVSLSPLLRSSLAPFPLLSGLAVSSLCGCYPHSPRPNDFSLTSTLSRPRPRRRVLSGDFKLLRKPALLIPH